MCPDISEGLTVDGSPVQDAPAAALPEATPAERTETRDPSTDSADAIRRAVADPDTLPAIADGLTTAALPESDLERLERAVSDANEKVLDSIDPANPMLAEELSLGREARDELAGRELLDFARDEWVGDLDELAHRVGEMRAAVQDDGYAEALTFQLARELYPEDPEAAEAAYEWLAATGDQLSEMQTQAERQELLDELGQEAAKARVDEYHAIYKAWAEAQGLRPGSDSAKALFAQAQEFAKFEMGYDLERMVYDPRGWDAKAFDAILRSAGAVLAEQDAANRHRAIQKSVLEGPSTSISEGLEHRNAFGEWISDVPILPTEVEVDADRVVRRAQRSRPTAADIRATVSGAESTSVADGLTGPNGKSITFDEASGGTRRHQQAEAEKLARARALGAQVAS
jgi:hypothetical protein